MLAAMLAILISVDIIFSKEIKTNKDILNPPALSDDKLKQEAKVFFRFFKNEYQPEENKFIPLNNHRAKKS